MNSKKDNDKDYTFNSSMLALKEVQTAFEGEAKKVGINDESEVADFINSTIKNYKANKL